MCVKVCCIVWCIKVQTVCMRIGGSVRMVFCYILDEQICTAGWCTHFLVSAHAR